MNPMIDFSGISNQSFVGRLLRSTLRWIPRGATVRVLQGPMKGMRWVAGSATNGCWLGSYEVDKQHAITETLREGNVFLDVGANVGFYSLLASRCVGESGRVVAFEPFPENISFLRRHVELNQLTNVEVIEAAVADQAGSATFSPGPDGCTGRLETGQSATEKCDNESITVKLVILDDLVAGEQIPVPNAIKIDVEGAEAAVLKGASNLLRDHHPVIFLATHGKHVRAECLDLLHELGYQCSSLEEEKDLMKVHEFIALANSSERR